MDQVPKRFGSIRAQINRRLLSWSELVKISDPTLPLLYREGGGDQEGRASRFAQAHTSIELNAGRRLTEIAEHRPRCCCRGTKPAPPPLRSPVACDVVLKEVSIATFGNGEPEAS